MNIFGVGGMELGLILIIMLIVAGPKRMIRWAYIFGTYTAKLRKMWEETVDYIQKEVDEAGLDIQVPKEIPTRNTLNREIGKIMKPVTDQVEGAMAEVNDLKKTTVASTRIPPLTPKPSTSAPKPATAATPPPATTTSTPAPSAPVPETPAASNGSFGTWSGSSEPQDREASS